MGKSKTIKKAKSAAALRKKYNSDVADTIVVSAEDMLWIPSSVIAVNHLTGGGLPFGKIMEIFGEESAGKSLLAYDFARSTQKLGGKVLWADGEYAFTRDWAQANELDLNDVELLKNKSIETISDWSVDMGNYYRSQLTNNEPMLLVIDSIAALDCLANENLEQSDRKAEMGNRAKAMDLMLRSRNDIWEKLGMGVILINQLRSKIGASQFEDPDTTPGGKATKFYASIRLGVYGGKQIKGKVNGVEERVGRVSTIRVKKNKVAPPRKTLSKVPVHFNPEFDAEIGFDRYFEIDEILLKTGVLDKKKGGSIYKFRGNTLVNGRDNLINLIREDDKLRRKLLRKTGINTISNTRRKMKNSPILFKPTV